MVRKKLSRNVLVLTRTCLTISESFQRQCLGIMFLVFVFHTSFHEGFVTHSELRNDGVLKKIQLIPSSNFRFLSLSVWSGMTCQLVSVKTSKILRMVYDK